MSLDLKRIFKSDWFISLILLGVFLITTGYTYGWDDQHLEIPLLKQLIDNSLYQGDYYVESLRQNFSTFFYPILAKFITVEQIPTTYFILYLVSRYFLFFWIYKLWRHIAQNRFSAFACVSVLITVVRVQEFLYRTFSHQEFTFAIIFAGIYFFFKERFYLSALLLGIAANFHALYSLFPMLFMCLYLLVTLYKHSIKKLIISGGIFSICCLPFLIWNLTSPGHKTGEITNWIPLFMKACPQNFMFPPYVAFETLITHPMKLLISSMPYVLLIVLFLFNLTFNPKFRINGKAVCFCIGAFGLLILSLIFTYFYPIRRVVDLNLIRNTQFLLFLLTGFTTIFIIEKVQTKNIFVLFTFPLLFAVFKYGNTIFTLSITVMFCICLLLWAISQKSKLLKFGLSFIPIIIGMYFAYQLVHAFQTSGFTPNIMLYFKIIFGLLGVYTLIYTFLLRKKQNPLFSYIFIIIPLAVHFSQFTQYHYTKLQTIKEGQGFWKLQNNWENMQHYVKENTPKNAMLLVPYNMEMGGFRIGSERKIIASYRDCGIVGFDYPAALEWERRIKDIESFRIVQRNLDVDVIKTAVTKYDADYIVFMSYATPGPSAVLEPIYANDGFALFKVRK